MSGNLKMIGFLGCNFCGSIKVVNARHESIFWSLCKDCNFVYQKSCFINEFIDGVPRRRSAVPVKCRYTKPSSIDTSGPHGERTVSNENIYWDPLPDGSYAIQEEMKNEYYLLNPPVHREREFPIKIPFNSPRYRTLIRVLNAVDSDSDEFSN